MSRTHFPAIIVGAGQAGLAVSYALTEQHLEHVLLEKNRVGHAWRNERWDTFCLVTPNWQCQLPGHPYRGAEPNGFMKREAIVDYVTSYATAINAPVREGVGVHRLRQDTQRFRLDTSAGALTADQVVVATGAYHTPLVPAYARNLPPELLQLHSSEYRCPEALPPGDVLVVGTGQSGCQIAEDLHLAGRRVHLCVGNAPRCARVYRGKDVAWWLDQMGHYNLPFEEHPNRDQVREKTNHYLTGRDGGRDIDLREFAQQGMQLYGPLTGCTGHELEFKQTLRRNLDEADAVYNRINHQIDEYIAAAGLSAPPATRYEAKWQPSAEPSRLDLRHSSISSVIWCIGFATDFSWVELPVLDQRGFPVHERGVTEVPGLYFVGLPWLYTWGSGRFAGVGRDALHIAKRMAAHASRVPAVRAAL